MDSTTNPLWPGNWKRSTLLPDNWAVNDRGQACYFFRGAWHLAKATPNARGYCSIGSVEKSTYLHRAVTEAFHGAPPHPRAHARHLDGDANNNHPQNLRWGSAYDNAQDRRRHGRYARGAQHPAAKRSGVDDLKAAFAVQEVRRGVPRRVVAQRLGMKRSQVHDLALGRRRRDAVEKTLAQYPQGLKLVDGEVRPCS
ncbi:MAG: HNH endonuclease [Myxococcota bacterium]